MSIKPSLVVLAACFLALQPMAVSAEGTVQGNVCNNGTFEIRTGPKAFAITSDRFAYLRVPAGSGSRAEADYSNFVAPRFRGVDLYFRQELGTLAEIRNNVSLRLCFVERVDVDDRFSDTITLQEATVTNTSNPSIFKAHIDIDNIDEEFRRFAGSSAVYRLHVILRQRSDTALAISLGKLAITGSRQTVIPSDIRTANQRDCSVDYCAGHQQLRTFQRDAANRLMDLQDELREIEEAIRNPVRIDPRSPGGPGRIGRPGRDILQEGNGPDSRDQIERVRQQLERERQEILEEIRDLGG